MILQNQQQRVLRRVAFTLMEILVVVAIIVALAGVGGFFLIGQLQQSKGEIAKIQSKELAKGCKTYFIRTQQWPNSLADLVNPSLPGGPILEDPKAILDPWQQPYQMEMGPFGPIVFAIEPGTNRVIRSSD